jgi:hypothetical protein
VPATFSGGSIRVKCLEPSSCSRDADPRLRVPAAEWLDSHPPIATAWNWFPRGAWCVVQDETSTCRLRYGTIYVYDGSRWR